MIRERSSGVLLHITSLPGRRGIGTLGPEAEAFADFLKAAGMRYWQLLPLGPVEASLGYSPYASTSAFAMNPLFISLEKLAAESWFPGSLAPSPFPEGHFVPFDEVVRHRQPVMERACEAFFSRAGDSWKTDYEAFRAREKHWLDDYALYAAAAEEAGTGNWLAWDRDLSMRKPAALRELARRRGERVRFHAFTQFILFRQWRDLAAHCAGKGIRLIGDIPIYITLASADAWAHPEILQLDGKSRLPRAVSGVPPDYFSETGQRWGNPLYRWKRGPFLSRRTLRWWARRIRHLHDLVDIVRIDHFRGFEAYWSIPAEEATAVRGTWVKGPGIRFFKRLRALTGDLDLIAEDLGVITPEVEELRDRLGLPGMKILQFAFDGDSGNYYLPHNISTRNCVLYTGTHDNNTVNGWFYEGEVDEGRRKYILEYLGLEDWKDFHWALMRQAYRTIADLVIIPAQDIPGYGKEFRMNIPGTVEGNWRWKLTSGAITEEMTAKLRRMAGLYGRLPVRE